MGAKLSSIISNIYHNNKKKIVLVVLVLLTLPRFVTTTTTTTAVTSGSLKNLSCPNCYNGATARQNNNSKRWSNSRFRNHDTAAFVGRNIPSIAGKSNHGHKRTRLNHPSSPATTPFFPSRGFILSSATRTAASEGRQRLQQQKQQQPRGKKNAIKRHPIFQTTNVHTIDIPYPSIASTVWKKLVPEDDDDQRKNNNNNPWSSFLMSSPLVGGHYGKRHQKERGTIGVDVTIQFRDPGTGAEELLRQCNLLDSSPSSSDDENEAEGMNITIRHLTDVLFYYQTIVSSNHNHNTHDEYKRKEEDNEPPEKGMTTTTTKTTTAATTTTKCKARIVSTRGPIGTKCPRWHVDHVPVRLVMSLVGPGCVYVPMEMERQGRRGGGGGGGGNTDKGEERKKGEKNEQQQQQQQQRQQQQQQRVVTSGAVIVNREALNNLEETDTTRANEIIVSTGGRSDTTENYGNEIGFCAEEGVGLLIVGKEWEDEHHDDDDDEEESFLSGSSSSSSPSVLAAVHKSPHLDWMQGRVLLTVDVVPEDK